MDHHIQIIIFGLTSLLSHNNSDMSDINFQTFSILLSWLFLILFGTSFKWADMITTMFFTFTLLFALASRLAKYNAPEIAPGITRFSMALIAGLTLQCFHKGHVGSGILMFSILLIEWININIPFEESVDLSGIFPDNLFPEI